MSATKAKDQKQATPTEAFHRAIVRIRDILRSPTLSITGMDSMQTLCLYLQFRTITKARAAVLGIDERFAWESLMDTLENVEGGTELVMERVNSPTGDCLLRHVDELYGTKALAFEVKNLAKNKEIFEILDAVDPEAVSSEKDMLGWVYEEHLKTGSSAARDLGQFFTDRAVCRYMVGLCRPGFKAAGVPESICDPSMGTGGFLTACLKYYEANHPGAVNWKVQEKEVYGNDSDPKVAAIAKMNLAIETGGTVFHNLGQRDSLYEGLDRLGYDVILANMPFGLKGIKHADCCEQIKKLKIRGIKSEPLFLQLMMASLNPGGRCAVVVPDGLLVNTSALHVNTRRHLLDNFQLHRVVKMKGAFFMNTGIQPSILFFENSGRPTGDIEFWDLGGDVSETRTLTVPATRLDKNLSFDPRRYAENPVLSLSRCYPLVALKEVLIITVGKANKERTSTPTSNTPLPYYDSNGVIGFVAEPSFTGEYTITARKLSIGAVHYVSGAFQSSDNTINFTSQDVAVLLNRYFYFWLLANKGLLLNLSSGVKPGIRKSDVAELKMPLPPLGVQKEVIAMLNRVFSPGVADALACGGETAPPNVADLPAAGSPRFVGCAGEERADIWGRMTADCKAQMRAIVKGIDRRKFEVKHLSEILKIVTGKANKERTKEPTNDRAVPYYDSNGINGFVAEPLFDGEFTITARKLSIGAVHYVSGRFQASDNAIILSSLDSDVLLDRYFYFWLLNNTEVLLNLSSGVKPGIRKSDVAEITMPLPPVGFQRDVVARLDVLQNQMASLAASAARCEDNARFILESYLAGNV